MKTDSKSSVFRAIALGLGASLIVGCAASTPTIDTSPEAKQSYDGMYPVKGGRMGAAWARSDFSIEKYSKVMLESIGVEYRPGGSERRRLGGSGPDNIFALTDDQKKRIQEVMSEAFVEELKKGEQFELVTEAGPDVLLLHGGLIDVISFVPPDPVGSGEIFLSRLGEATLIFELRDSASGAILLRAADRRTAEDSGRNFTNSNRATNTAEIRRLARSWGMTLREGLDRFMAEGDEAGE